LAILDKFSLSDPDNMSDDTTPTESKKKPLFAIVKADAPTDFVKWEGIRISKTERVEVAPELKKQATLAPLLDFSD